MFIWAAWHVILPGANATGNATTTFFEHDGPSRVLKKQGATKAFLRWSCVAL